MEDDSRSRSLVGSLKNEWSLFWESLAGEEEPSPILENSFETGRLKSMSLEDIRRITRSLSADRRRLNQKLESLNKEIELNQVKLESLRLVGSQDEDIVRRIGELHDQGQNLSDELTSLDSKIRLAREAELKLKRRPTSA